MAKILKEKYGIITLLHNEERNELSKVANIYNASDLLIEEYKTFPESEEGDVALLRKFNYEAGELLGEDVSIVYWTDQLDNIANPPGPAITDIILSDEEIEETALPGDLVATISVVGGSTPITYEIINDPSNKFFISGDELRLSDTVDILDVSYAVGIRATDADEQTFQKGFSITVVPAVTFVNDFSTTFNGTDEYINVPDDATLDFTNTFSWSHWIKIDSGAIGGNLTTLAKWDNAGDQRAILSRVVTTGKYQIVISNLGTSATNFFMDSTATLVEETWYHIAVTWDNGAAKMYINGVEDKALTAGFSSVFVNSEPVFVGSVLLSGVPSQYFEGKIDELSMYDSVLGPTQITDIYNAGNPTDLSTLDSEPDMQLWFRMGDGDTLPTFTDNSQNSNDGTAINMDGSNISTDVPSIAVYQNVNSVDFDGVSQYLNVGTPPNLKNSRFDPFSLSFWIKKDTTASDQVILSYSDNAVDRGMACYIESGATNVIHFVLASDATKRIDVTSILGSGVTGSWNHVTLTYDGSSDASGVDIFLNGVALSTTIVTDNLTGNIGNTNPVHIGAFVGGSGFYDGKIDELSTYNVQLTPFQAAEIFNSGIPTDITTLTSDPDLTHWYRMGEDSTFPVIEDAEGTFDAIMINMSVANITTDVPT